MPCDNGAVARIPKKLPRDSNARAVAIARMAIGEDEENIDTRPLDTITTARKRASSGGRARFSTLSPARRRQIAKKAAAARWRKPH
jgi:hypothetical protein